MIQALIISMRPKQWTKNLIIFAAVIFSLHFFEISYFFKTILSFILFTLVSGSVYLYNDLKDIEEDRLHPVKSKRPIVSGKLSKKTAYFFLIVLALVGIISSFYLNISLGWIVAGYFILHILYSNYLKHIVIFDIFCIAAGFVMRAAAGAVVINVEISSWLLVCTILLSLFLAMGKRRSELVELADDANKHRKILEHYSLTLLDQMISVVTAATVVSYSLYTMSEETIQKFHTSNLKYTIPFVLYGIFRYLYIIHKGDKAGAPEKALYTDISLLGNLILFAVAVGIILYA